MGVPRLLCPLAPTFSNLEEARTLVSVLILGLARTTDYMARNTKTDSFAQLHAPVVLHLGPRGWGVPSVDREETKVACVDLATGQ